MMFRAFLFRTDTGAYRSVGDDDTYKTGRSPTRSCTYGSAAAEPNRHRASTPRLWPCTLATAARAASTRWTDPNMTAFQMWLRRDHSPVITRSWIIDQRPSAIAVTSVLLARFFLIAQPLRSRRSGGRRRRSLGSGLLVGLALIAVALRSAVASTVSVALRPAVASTVSVALRAAAFVFA